MKWTVNSVTVPAVTTVVPTRVALGRVRSVDLVAPALIAVAGTIEIVGAGNAHWPLGVVFLVLTCGAVALVRRFPVGAPLAVGVLYLVPALLGFDIAESGAWVFPLPLAAFGAGRYASPERRSRSLASVLLMMLLAIVTLEWLTSFDPNVVFGLAGSVGPWLFGVGIERATARAERASAALERARLEGALESGAAVRGERERMAAELHDVLAHTLGELVVRASAARDRLAVDARDAAVLLGGIAATGRAALAETGTLLRLLRDEADPGAARPRRDDDPRVWRPAVGDVAWPCVFVALAIAEILGTGLDPAPLWIGGCLIAAAALVVRRWRPCGTVILVAAFLAAPLALSSADDYPAAWIIAFAIVGFSAGLRAPAARSLPAVVLAWAIVVVAPFSRGNTGFGDVLLSALFVFGPWVAGAAHARALARAQAAGVAEERERMRSRRDAAAAVEEERRQVARELHDTLASSLSVMVVQAALAEELAGSDPVRAAAAAEAVESAGRRALEDLGALLRRSSERLPYGATGPRQGIADIASLADDFRRAGVAVDLEVDAIAGGLPAGVELATYRIVQEGLTNVLKHAPGSSAAVRLVCDGPAVAIEISNGPSVRGSMGLSSGHGLVGLRERVAHHGGMLAAAATPEGGFRLSARLPAVPEAA
jgi:signal transduction histidine kinase